MTDIAWGLLPTKERESIFMIVSLLDGFMVALKFDLPLELGKILSKEKKHKIFRLKYGIELGSVGSGRRLVDDKSGPKLIENVLQFAMEEDDEGEDEGGNEISSSSDASETGENGLFFESSNACIDSSKQIESRSKSGKKRIQPILLNESSQQPASKSIISNVNGKKNKTGKLKLKSQTKHQGGSVSEALHLAEKAASLAEGISDKKTKKGSQAHKQTNDSTNMSNNEETRPYAISQKKTTHFAQGIDLRSMQNVVPPKTNQNVYSIELQSSKTQNSVLEDKHDNSKSKKISVVATCTNSTHSPPGVGRGVPCSTLSISCSGERTWRDHLLGSHCTSLAACSTLLAVGTFDGTVYLYGTSPTSGWDSGMGFRSHTPFVMSSSVVHLFLREKHSELSTNVPKVEMLVLTSDGTFGVYSIIPSKKLLYKGSIIAPMNQMCLSMYRS